MHPLDLITFFMQNALFSIIYLYIPVHCEEALADKNPGISGKASSVVFTTVLLCVLSYTF